MEIMETVYEVWKERNDMLFSQNSLDPHMKDIIIDNGSPRCGMHRKLCVHINDSRLVDLRFTRYLDPFGSVCNHCILENQ